jgi:hypothetical protein
MGAHAVACDAASGVGGVEEGGGDTMSGLLLPLSVALVAITAAQGTPFSVGEILSDPDRFDGQMVTIEGTMTNLRQRVSSLGDPYYKFDLSDGKQAIRVISAGTPRCRSGAVMVEGTFAKIKRGRQYVVNASRVICRREKSRDEPGAGRACGRRAGWAESPSAVIASD